MKKWEIDHKQISSILYETVLVVSQCEWITVDLLCVCIMDFSYLKKQGTTS